MRISELLRVGAPALSFEFFPPKDDLGFWDLYRTVESLKPLAPAFVSVTYGAGGATRRKTIDLVARIKSDIGIESMAHLTCVGASQSELGAVIDRIECSGIENVLALRGDPPHGQACFAPVAGGFTHASDLVRFVRERCGLCVGAACYPEGHPESPNQASDLDHLRHKVDVGAEFLISQLFFDNSLFLAFRERAERVGIRVPIIAGIMPILTVGQVKRFTGICGATIPPELLSKIEAVEDDAEAVSHIGMYHATRQCEDLLRQNVAGIHFYTLNRSTSTRAIYQLIRAGLPAPALAP